MTKLRVAEFYSGIGGMHFALCEAGIDFEVVGAFEINDKCNAVYRHNFSDTPIRQANLKGVTVEQLSRLNADFWTMSPPCQPFTRQGKQRDTLDSRTDSFLHLLEMLKRLLNAPQYFVLENVKGFETSKAREELVSTISSLGYRYQEFLVNPTQLGTPNSRLRYYLLATRRTDDLPQCIRSQSDSTGIQLEQPNCSSTQNTDTTPQQILQFLQHLESEDEYQLAERVLGKQAEVLDIVTPTSTRSCCFTKAYSSYVEGTGSVLYTGDWQLLDDAFVKYRLESNVDQKTSILRPLGIRYFTPREIANFLGFPSEFGFPPAITKQQRYKMLGNSISVKMVACLVTCLFSNTEHFQVGKLPL